MAIRLIGTSFLTTFGLARRGATALALAALTVVVAGCGGGDSVIEPPASATLQTDVRALSNGRGTPANQVVFSVRAVTPVNILRVSKTVVEYEYAIVLQNKGPAVNSVMVQLVEPGPGIEVLDGIVITGPLAANSTTKPSDTIKIRKPVSGPFLLQPNTWQFTVGGTGVLAGTAAVGAALANGRVTVTDAFGVDVCAQNPIFTSGTGTFTCTVLAGTTAPFLVVVRDPFAAYPPLVSVVAAAPAGTTLITNATPITTAIVGQLAPDGNPLTVVSNPSLIDLAALNAITTNVLAQIAPVLTALGAPADYDPFTTQIVAATSTQAGNTADQVIEALRFSTVNGVNLVATVDNPDGATPLANATTAQPPLPAPSSTLLSLFDGSRLITNTLANCFAQPVSSRVLAFDTSIPATQGGPAVTSFGAACQNITHPNYFNNGYTTGQRFFGLLNSPAMVGAIFQPAEVLLYIDDTSAADQDKAALNIRYVDANGVVANLIELAQKLPGSATAAHPSDWWLYGTQQPVETSVSSFVRRSEQFAPNPGTAPFVNASTSRFEVGISFFVNKDGPGSTGLRAARIFGPGLPTTGLVYTRPDPSIITNQTWLNIRRKDGLTDPASATLSDDVGNIFRLGRTQGLTGSAATTTRPNPNAGNTDNTAFVVWAHPMDYGADPGTTTESYINFSSLKANSSYTIELFYVGEASPRHTLSKTMLTPVTPATYAHNLEWVPLTAATLRYLEPTDPLGAAQASMNLAWTPNAFAETIRSCSVSTFGAGVSVNDGLIGVAPGGTTGVANAPSGSIFPTLTNDGSSRRQIQLRYRTLDGSTKDSVSRYN